MSHLVSSAYQVKVVAVQELAHYISTKREGNSTIILTPSLDVFVWV